MPFATTPLVEGFISEAIRGRASFWVPGLAQLLAQRFWQCRGRAFDVTTYGSLRWLRSDPLGLRVEVSAIDIVGADPIVIEALPLQTRQGYKAIGLDLLTEAPTTEDIVLFQDAFTLLKAGSGLSDAVVALVRSVHLLAGSGNGYDTSHSEPNLPCSIFVSVPTGQQYAEFRLAESILHEAMHLQLTMLEKEAPLLCNTSATGYSPWQQTVRPVKGLLHGLFVFSVINQWLAELRAGGVLGEEGHIYIARRRAQIAEEVAMVSELSVYPALTEFGRTFADWLIGTRS